jgi:DNA primase large subunit
MQAVDECIFQVRWTRVPDLVEKRKVFLNGGWAYVPESAQSSIVYQEFESKLKKGLEVSDSVCCNIASWPKHYIKQMAAQAFVKLDEDTRIVPILENLSRGFLAGVPSEWNESSSSGNETNIKAEMVDEIARKHYPLCMRHLHGSLRRDHHLKYFGRLQYGLFLKVVLSPYPYRPLTNAPRFWASRSMSQSFFGGKLLAG